MSAAITRNADVVENFDEVDGKIKKMRTEKEENREFHITFESIALLPLILFCAFILLAFSIPIFIFDVLRGIIVKLIGGRHGLIHYAEYVKNPCLTKDENAARLKQVMKDSYFFCTMRLIKPGTVVLCNSKFVKGLLSDEGRHFIMNTWLCRDEDAYINWHRALMDGLQRAAANMVDTEYSDGKSLPVVTIGNIAMSCGFTRQAYVDILRDITFQNDVGEDCADYAEFSLRFSGFSKQKNLFLEQKVATRPALIAVKKPEHEFERLRATYPYKPNLKSVLTEIELKVDSIYYGIGLREDGWWEVETDPYAGEVLRGYAPSTFLERHRVRMKATETYDGQKEGGAGEEAVKLYEGQRFWGLRPIENGDWWLGETDKRDGSVVYGRVPSHLLKKSRKKKKRKIAIGGPEVPAKYTDESRQDDGDAGGHDDSPENEMRKYMAEIRKARAVLLATKRK
eukprot:g4867.t1